MGQTRIMTEVLRMTILRTGPWLLAVRNASSSDTLPKAKIAVAMKGTITDVHAQKKRPKDTCDTFDPVKTGSEASTA